MPPPSLVSPQLTDAILLRLQQLAHDLARLDQRLSTLPEHRMDDEDREEVRRLKAWVALYSATVLEWLEPHEAVHNWLEKASAMSDDLLATMERFVLRTQQGIDQALLAIES